jgi:hypothetical protein
VAHGAVVGSPLELTDSNDICADPQLLRERLRQDGYVFVRGLIDPSLVGSADEQARAALRRAGWVDADGRALTPVRRGDWTDAGFRGFGIAADVHRLAYESGPQRLMSMLLGCGAFVYPVKVPRAVYPDRLAPDHRGRFVHQDYAVIGKQDMFTMWIPLQDLPIETGPLAVLPGSSRRGWARPERLADSSHGWASIHFRQGDVLVFHCLTWHAALPNVTDRLRLSVDVRWQLQQEPVPATMIYGPARRRADRSVELFGRLFRGQRWWHPVPGGLTIAESTAPPAGATIPLSRYVDFPRGQRQPAVRSSH